MKNNSSSENNIPSQEENQEKKKHNRIKTNNVKNNFIQRAIGNNLRRVPPLVVFGGPILSPYCLL